jgi:RNA polymerase sigma-70 factor (ECF subfamily)
MVFEADEDTRLLRGTLNGDETAWRRIEEKYYGKVYIVAKGILGNTQDAEDAVQETFLQIYQNLPRFRQESQFSTWVFRIAVNTAIQISRRRKGREKEVSLEEAVGIPDPKPIWHDEGDLIRNALSRLKAQDRAILVLVYWEGFSLTEAAAVLSCTPNAAKTRLHRARERLRKILEEMGGFS